MEKQLSHEDMVGSIMELNGDNRMQRLFDELIGEEDISRRMANVKHFNLGGNRYQAVIYPKSVHYQEAGQWKEIDDTLESVSDGKRRVLRNKAGALKLELEESAVDNRLVKLMYKGKTLNWSFEGQKSVKANIIRRTPADIFSMQHKITRDAMIMGQEALQDAPEATCTPQDVRVSLLDRQSNVSYRDILPGVTVHYTLSGDCVKEDIVVNDVKALQHVALHLTTEGLSYEAQEDNSVSVFDKETKERLFTFQPPIVYDSAEPKKSTMAQVALAPHADYVRMTYVLDEVFQKEAVYPITIDPVVKTEQNTTAISDTTLIQADPTSIRATGTLLYVGIADSKERVALIKFNKLVKIKTSDTIIRARLQLQTNNVFSGEKVIGAYKVLKPWTDTTVNWENFPPNSTNIDTAVQDYAKIASSASNNTKVTFDITNLYREWYVNGKNNGVALRKLAGVTGNNYQDFCSVNEPAPGHAPIMIVDYMSHAGLESWWTYESMSAGRAGTAHVDIFNGNAVVSHGDTAMNGRRIQYR